MNAGRDLLRTKETITDLAVRECKCRPAEAGSVLLSFKLSIGKVGIAQVPLYTNEAIAALPIKEPARIGASYLYWALRSIDLTLGLDRAAKGSTLNTEKLRRIEIPLPPLPEQQRIAEVLDRADAVRAKRRAALVQLDTLAQSIFLDMFGDPTYNPRGWPTRELREVVRQGTIVTYGIVQAGDEFPGGVPYIRTGDITGGKIAVGDLRRTDPETAKRFSRSRVDTGDIVMSIRATVGTTALVPPELHGANLTQGTARIAPGPSVSGQYLLAHLRAPGTQHWLSQQIKGATFREITLARLRQLPVAVPPLGLQQDFCHRVARVENLKASGSASLAQLDALFASLQARAFAGEL